MSLEGLRTSRQPGFRAGAQTENMVMEGRSAPRAFILRRKSQERMVSVDGEDEEKKYAEQNCDYAECQSWLQHAGLASLSLGSDF